MCTTCSRSGMSSRWIRPACSHSSYGCSAASSDLTSSSSMMRCSSVSTRNIRPGWSRPLRTTFAGVDVEHADLGGQDDEAVVGDPVARGPQAVAVEDRADLGAVGEHDAGGAVPGLHQRGVELVERAAGRVHLGVVLPRLGDHHQHRVRQRAPAHVQQLEHLVEGRRVRGTRACRSGRAARGRPGIRSEASSASRARIQLRLPMTVLISPLWAMNRNGWASGQLGNVLVEKRECTTASAEAIRSSTQVGEELVELVGGQHALVDQGARGQRREVRRRSRARRACAGRTPAAPAPCRSPGSRRRPRRAG